MRPNDTVLATSGTLIDNSLMERAQSAYPNAGFRFPVFGYNLLVHWVDAFNYELRQRFVVYVNSQTFENHSTIQCNIVVVSPIEKVKRKQFPVVEWEAEYADMIAVQEKRKGRQ